MAKNRLFLVTHEIRRIGIFKYVNIATSLNIKETRSVLLSLQLLVSVQRLQYQNFVLLMTLRTLGTL